MNATQLSRRAFAMGASAALLSAGLQVRAENGTDAQRFARLTLAGRLRQLWRAEFTREALRYGEIAEVNARADGTIDLVAYSTVASADIALITLKADGTVAANHSGATAIESPAKRIILREDGNFALLARPGDKSTLFLIRAEAKIDAIPLAEKREGELVARWGGDLLAVYWDEKERNQELARIGEGGAIAWRFALPAGASDVRAVADPGGGLTVIHSYGAPQWRPYQPLGLVRFDKDGRLALSRRLHLPVREMALDCVALARPVSGGLFYDGVGFGSGERVFIWMHDDGRAQRVQRPGEESFGAETLLADGGFLALMANGQLRRYDSGLRVLWRDRRPDNAPSCDCGERLRVLGDGTLLIFDEHTVERYSFA